ncbi:hypothetical protein MNKW57_09570 [Biformimicrobium ophioploci]|uniref:DUF1570 domain-containing protein n=1 Tax=Biformimicrobium ophioploci TaxID=3036711 RepID=A0ABQ6LWZ7_9GAMM|nr:hypothetical protein MNKW57_09570 [Microbulbifer sp. NKW57]
MPAYANASWTKYESSNFIVYSDYADKSVKKKIERLERFKATLNKLLSIPEAAGRVPFEIYWFKNRREFRKYTEDFDTAGFFLDRLGSPVMVVGPGYGDEVLFHEYIHFLTRRLGSFKYPRWYDEGIAEFYSTMEFKGGDAIVGAVPDIRKSWLQHRPKVKLSELLEHGYQSRGSQFTARFYASSWLLVHRLILGYMNNMPDYNDGLRDYLKRYTEGEKGAEVFMASIGADEADLQSELSHYARKRNLKLGSMKAPKVAVQIQAARLDKAEALNAMVRLALAKNDWKYAEELLRDDEATLDTEGRAVLAIIEGHGNEVPGSEVVLIEALEASSELSGAASNFLGHALFDLAEKPGASSEQNLIDAVNYLMQAREQGQLHGEARMLVEALWSLGREEEAIAEIVRLIQSNPASIATNMLAGEYMIKARALDEAKYFLRKVVNWSHSESQVKYAEKLLAKLDSIIAVTEAP